MHIFSKPIGILGGTFDPIHLGHLRMGIELYENLNLSKIHIIPCYQPVHRNPPIASTQSRLAMVQCAVQDEDVFYVDAREIHRQGPSYAIDTLIDLRNEMPNTPLCLLVGIDAFLGFTTWHRYQEILALCHIVVAHRPHYQLPTTGLIAELMKERLQNTVESIHQNLAGIILFRPITALEISASDIRNQIAAGKNPRYLIPDQVYSYIKQHAIYNIHTKTTK